MTTQLDLPALGQNQMLRADRISILTRRPVRKYYWHGWQSWSLAAWIDPRPLPIQKPDIFHPLQIDPVYAGLAKLHGSWLGALEFDRDDILLLGALSTDAHVWLEDDSFIGEYESVANEWFIARGRETEVFSQYARHLGERLGRPRPSPGPRVWCSWYSLYTTIDERILNRIFDELGNLPFDVLQVDDGWQLEIGDWEANEKFPSGMKALAENIRARGRRPGLWLAPLIATRTSRLFRDHPDWFLRDGSGKPVSAGFNWGQYVYAVDTTNPELEAWLIDLMKKVRGWGFDYLKLDFLYAGALRAKRYANQPREAAFRESLRLMRSALGEDAFLLTCGTPIIPSLGLSDAIRAGPDVSHHWEKYRDTHLLYNPTMVATRNAIRTVVHRLWLQQLVHVDPDVAYFESKENSLTIPQKQLLQELAVICNFKATSDLPRWMNSDEISQLRNFLGGEAAVEQSGRYLFTIDNMPVDFAAVMPLPVPPTGLIRLWGALLGWLGSLPFVLRIYKRIDDNALRRRRASLE